jgi:sulfate transport system ATP-binding protein
MLEQIARPADHQRRADEEADHGRSNVVRIEPSVPEAAAVARLASSGVRGGSLNVTIEDLRKSFGETAALHGVSLDIKGGELIALLGPSGSGKTTLLRLIAGLDFPTAGRILFGDDDASCKSVQERHVGFVFQHYALFRHMTVFENVAFGLRVRPRRLRPTEAAIRKRVMTLLDLVQLSGLEKRFPMQLSGGQRQRVALARALAIEPRILLLDEPFGALDAKVRKELRGWLRELHDKTGHTTVFVTHDQDEALELADRVVVMNNGRIEQIGTADEIYDRPETPFVFSFIGDVNALPVTVSRGRVYLEDHPLTLDAHEQADGPATLYFRPSHVKVAAAGSGAVEGIVSGVRRVGDLRRLELEAGAGSHRFEIDIPLDAQVPKRGRFAVTPTAWRVFARG